MAVRPGSSARRVSKGNMAARRGSNVRQASRAAGSTVLRAAARVPGRGGGLPGPGNRGGMGRGGKLDLTPTVEKERVSNYDPNKKQYVRQNDPRAHQEPRRAHARRL